MDPMSDILGLLQPSSYGFRGLDASGSWSIAFAPVAGLKCQALRSGACWLRLDDGSAPVRFVAGDLMLLPGSCGFQLYTDQTASPIDGYGLFASVALGATAVLNGGGSTEGVGGFFKFESAHAHLLLDALPSLVHIRAGATEGALNWPIDRMMRELRAPQPGGALVARHLAQTLLIEALRLHLAEQPKGGTGWLYALADPGIHAAMAAMHADPARRWNLQDLARTAGMSRTSFAGRFRDTSGETAMDYLIRWRMLVAADVLKTGRQSIAIVARMVGYESESAFGAAFKRVIGQPPRRFAKS